jgi:hypothetical protein
MSICARCAQVYHHYVGVCSSIPPLRWRLLKLYRTTFLTLTRAISTQGGMDTWLKQKDHTYVRHNNTGACRSGGPQLNPSYCYTPASVPTTCPATPPPRMSSLWQPGIDEPTADAISAIFAAHPAAYNTISVTWAFWNSKWNSKCNNSQGDDGLCYRTFGNDSSPAWTLQRALVKEHKTALVPIIEVCCVCVLNASYDYTPGMDALIDDAVANGFSGYALDMVCGGQDEPQRAVFLSEFITRAREKIPGFTVSWWTHYA